MTAKRCCATCNDASCAAAATLVYGDAARRAGWELGEQCGTWVEDTLLSAARFAFAVAATEEEKNRLDGRAP